MNIICFIVEAALAEDARHFHDPEASHGFDAEGWSNFFADEDNEKSREGWRLYNLIHQAINDGKINVHRTQENDGTDYAAAVIEQWDAMQ